MCCTRARVLHMTVSPCVSLHPTATRKQILTASIASDSQLVSRHITRSTTACVHHCTYLADLHRERIIHTANAFVRQNNGNPIAMQMRVLDNKVIAVPSCSFVISTCPHECFLPLHNDSRVRSWRTRMMSHRLLCARQRSMRTWQTSFSCAITRCKHQSRLLSFSHSLTLLHSAQ